MDRKEMVDLALRSDILTKWHWFGYHFQFYTHGHQMHPFAEAIIDACFLLEKAIPGCGRSFIDKIASVSGREKYHPHYEQLLQILSELLILSRVVSYQWSSDQSFKYEPSEGQSRKNPEIEVSFQTNTIGIEVKAPSLLQHQTNRAKNPMQIPARSQVKDVVDGKFVTLPRDNPIKDFLLSANDKFRSFKEARTTFSSLLVIVWDDFVYEPISALTSMLSGMFTGNSFAKDGFDNPLKFENVDAVIIIRHLDQFALGFKEQPLRYGFSSILDYGNKDQFPFKVIIFNPFVQIKWPECFHDKIRDCFNVYLPDASLGAEYLPSDLIHWM